MMFPVPCPRCETTISSETNDTKFGGLYNCPRCLGSVYVLVDKNKKNTLKARQWCVPVFGSDLGSVFVGIEPAWMYVDPETPCSMKAYVHGSQPHLVQQPFLGQPVGFALGSGSSFEGRIVGLRFDGPNASLHVEGSVQQIVSVVKHGLGPSKDLTVAFSGLGKAALDTQEVMKQAIDAVAKLVPKGFFDLPEEPVTIKFVPKKKSLKDRFKEGL